MTKISIDKSAAQKAINKAKGETKEVLEILFGNQLRPGNVKDRIKTFQEACNEVGVDYEKFMDSIKGIETDEAAYKKIKIIASALNEEWKPDWTNNNQHKYLPYFDGSNSFSGSYYYLCYTVTYVGSRLYYKSSDLAIYAGQQFNDIYKDFLSGT